MPASVPPGCEPTDTIPAADIEPGDLVTTVTANQAGSLHVRVTNLGPRAWAADWRLTYHVFDDNGNPVTGTTSASTTGPVALGVNSWAEFNATINPLSPATWRLVWDVALADGTLLSSQGACFNAYRLTVSNQQPSLAYSAPANWGTVTTRTPYLMVSGSDPDGWPGHMTYQFKICRDASLTVGCETSPWLNDPWWQPSALEWNGQYYWGAVVSDGSAQTSGLSVPQAFRIVLPAPDEWRTVGNGLGLAKVGDLVLPYGVFLHTDRDAQVADTAHPLYLERTFSSGASAVTGAFGQGWLSIFDASLVRNTSAGTMTATYPDGRQESFGVANGLWVSRTDLGLTTRVAGNADGSVAIRETSGEQVSYDAGGRLTSVESSAGRWDLTRGSQGTVTAITEHATGRSIKVQWGYPTCTGSARPTSPFVTAVTIARGGGLSDARWTYGYDCLRLTGMTDADGYTWRYSYGTSGSGFAITSPQGRQPAGLVDPGTWLTMSDRLERTVLLSVPGSPVPRKVRLLKPRVGSEGLYATVYNEFQGVTALYCDYRSVNNGVESCAGGPDVYRTVEFDRVGRMRMWARRQEGDGPGGGVFRTWQYDVTTGRLQSMIDETRVDIVSFVYDAWGNPVSTYTFRDSNTQVTSGQFISPDPVDHTVPTRLHGSVVTPNGANVAVDEYTHMYRYDSSGRLVARDGPTVPGAQGGEQASYTYTTGAEQAVDSNGVPIAGTLMPAGLIQTVSTAASTTTFDYDGGGDVTQEVASGGATVGRTFDARGFVLSETVSGARVDYVRDPLGRVSKETYACVTNAVTAAITQRVVDRSYDQDGLPTLVYERAIDCTTGVQVGASRVTWTVYDTQGRPTRVSAPSAAVTYYTYDLNNPELRSSVTDARGRVFRYTYDSWGRLFKITADVGVSGSTRAADIAFYQYDNAGRLIYQADALFRGTSYEYTDDDYRSRATAGEVPDSSGTGTHAATLWQRTFDGAGNVLTATIGGTQRTSYAYDAEGRLVAATEDPNGLNRASTIVRDAAGRVVGTELTDGTRTERTTWTLSAPGFVTEQQVWLSSNQALITRYEPNSLGEPTRIYDPRVAADNASASAFSTTASYDQLGQLVRAYGPVVQVDAPADAGASSQFQGLVQTNQQEVTTHGYDAFGDLTDVKDAQGNITHYVYDNGGRVIEMDQPSYRPYGASQDVTAVTTYAYSPAGDLRQTTDALGKTRDNTYDVAGNLVQSQGPEVSGGRPTVSYSYDDAGQLASTTSATGTTTTYGYDILGRKVASSTRVGSGVSAVDYVTSYTYDDAGNLLSVTTPAGRATRYTYDTAGEVTEVWLAGRTVPEAYAYDVAGRLIKDTDGAGRAVANTYDLAGRLVRTTSSQANGVVTKVESYEYDAASNLVAHVDGRGIRTTYTVDAANRITRVTQPVGGQANITIDLGYDVLGHQVRTRDGLGADTWKTYNSWGLPERVVEASTSRDPALADRSWLTGYDADGRTVQQTQPGGTTVTAEYDAAGRLTAEHGRGAAGSGVVNADRTFTYDLDDRLTIARAGTASPESFTWDGRGLLVASTGPDGTDRFGYDGDGLRTSQGGAWGSTSFSRNTAGQVATMTDPRLATPVTWSYDPASGDLGSRSNATGTTSWTYDGLRRVSTVVTRNTAGATVQDVRYQYDGDDNVTSSYSPTDLDHGGAYTYDLANRMTAWQPRMADGSLAPRASAWYSWDAVNNLRDQSIGVTWDGRTYDARGRIERATSDDDYQNTTTTVDVDPAGQVASMSGATSRSLDWDAFGQLLEDEQSTYTYDALGRLDTRNDAAFYYTGLDRDAWSAPSTQTGTSEQALRDPSGTIVASVGAFGSRLALSNAHQDQIAGLLISGSGNAGSLVAPTYRDPFGQTYTASGAGPDQRSTFGYQSDWTDPSTGMVNMDARWYDPSLGVFYSRDSVDRPITGPAALNRYGYADGNPVSDIDPTGHFSIAGFFGSVGNAVVSTLDSAGGVLAEAASVVDAGASAYAVEGIAELEAFVASAAVVETVAVAGEVAGVGAEVVGGVALAATSEAWVPVLLIGGVAAIAGGWAAYEAIAASDALLGTDDPGGQSPQTPVTPQASVPRVTSAAQSRTSATSVTSNVSASAGYRVLERTWLTQYTNHVVKGWSNGQTTTTTTDGGTQWRTETTSIRLLDPFRVDGDATTPAVGGAAQVSWTSAVDQKDCGLGGTLQSCMTPDPTPPASCGGPASSTQVCLVGEPQPGAPGATGATTPVGHNPAGTGGRAPVASSPKPGATPATSGAGMGGGRNGPTRTAAGACEPDDAANTVDDTLSTPQVFSTKLQNLVDNLYKGTTNPNRVGNGTTMDAIRNEIATGVPTAGCMHTIKGEETLRGLNNWLNRNPGADYHDRLVGQSLADELAQLLGGGS
jgi:RHS repeat-associated protein